MARCGICSNDYDNGFTVSGGGRQYVFDSFECAIHALASTCGLCRCRILGHGVEADDRIFCCANCARHAGVAVFTDRA